MIEKLKWLGHASFRIEGSKIVYIDPWKLKTNDKADIILVSHSHFDHLSVDDIKRIQKDTTVIVAPADCIVQMVLSEHADCFIVNLDGARIYYAGDTDFIPEMQALKDIDIALFPVGGTYTLTASEAAEAANSFMPRIAVPYHYGDIVGSSRDAEEFKSKCKCEVVILEQQ